MNIIKKLEAALIDIVSGVTPWLAPLIPAFLVYTNMTGRLGYPVWIGFIGAAAVEFLGLASVHTAMTFWTWNDSHKSERAPFWIAFGAGLFYVTIVLLVNAGLDIFDGQVWSRIAAHALLSLLSVDAAVIIAIRAQHARKLQEREDAKEERRTAKAQAQKTAKPQEKAQAETASKTAKPQEETAKEEFMTVWRSNGHHKVAALARELGVNERTAQNWVKSAEKTIEE